MLERLTTLNSDGPVRTEIVTKAKKSYTAFEKPGSGKPGRERPPKKGDGFCSKHMPKLGHYRKKGEPSPLECVEDGNARRKLLEAVCATEMHMALSCIAMGMLQCISLHLAGKPGSVQFRYQRTPSRSRVSEASVMHYLRKQFFYLLWQRLELRITQTIQELQNGAGACRDSLAS